MILPTIVDHTHLHFEALGLHKEVFSIGGYSLKWYSVAYIAGIVVGWWYMLRLIARAGAPMGRRHADDLAFYATMGVILGGRLGYVLFYAPDMILRPLSILRLWDGGMSFHGGVIGTSLGILWFARKHGLDWLRVHDYVACCVPFGLFFGRLGNFVNGELWGKPADVPWAIIFPNTGFDVARHPSQLYEAGLEGLVLFALLAIAFWRTNARYWPGWLTGLFLLGYGSARFVVEFFREPDAQFYRHDNPLYPFYHLMLEQSGIHMGQWLCVPMILGGAYLMLTATKRRRRVVPIAETEGAA